MAKKNRQLERPESFSSTFIGTVIAAIIIVVFALGTWQVSKFLLKLAGILK